MERRNNNRNNQNNNSQDVKKSGAKYSTIGKGQFKGYIIVNAWNKSKSKGLLTCTVSPYAKSDEIVTSQNGKEYVRMIAKVLYHNSGVEKIIPCLMNIQTKKISLQDIGMCITPNGSGVTSSGKRVTGYFGTMLK